MENSRELELIEEVTPCHLNYFDRQLLTFQQLKKRDYKACVNIKVCKSEGIPCALRIGLEMAGYVMKGNDLKGELMTFSRAEFIESPFWYSKDGKKFEQIKGRSNVLKAVEYFARTVLLEDTSKSVLTQCKKCNGVKLEEKVYDSVWFKKGPGPCAGSGKTKERIAEYCPNCEKKPCGGIVYQEDLDKEE